MYRNLSIVHIEDEYREFLDLVTFVKVFIEDFWDRQDNGDISIAWTKRVGQPEDGSNVWVVYEIHSEKRPVQKIRYIFVADNTFPEEAREFLFEDSIFILDVMRPVEGKTTQEVTVDKSLASVKDLGSTTGNTVFYTAHQGKSLQEGSAQFYSKISKESDNELERFIGSALIGILQNV